jgi:hypothetical protein
VKLFSFKLHHIDINALIFSLKRGGNMIVKLIILVFIMSFSVLNFSASQVKSIKITDLDEVLKPDAIVAFGDKFYITEDTTIKIFDLRDGKFIKSFGKKGEGPGEFKWRPIIKVFKDYLLANSSGKVLFFTHLGNYVREKKIQNNNSRYLPLSENFVGRKITQIEKSSKFTQSIGIYNGNFNLIKEIYRAPMPGTLIISSSQKGKQDYSLLNDFISWETCETKVFIGDTTKGFFFKVFDNHGNHLYDINKEYEKKRVTESFKKETIELQEAQPWFKRFKDVFKFVFPEYFPSFRYFTISDNKIYIQTFEKKNGAVEFIVLDLQGKNLARLFLPETTFDPRPLYTIYDGKYYYLLENEDEDIWELHQVNLNN